MAKAQEGSGYWQASDGRWYPPPAPPGAVTAPVSPAAPLAYPPAQNPFGAPAGPAGTYPSQPYQHYQYGPQQQATPTYRPATSGPSWGVVGAGVVLIIVGLAISIGTYQAASSSVGGGHYFVAYGPVLWGVAMVVRGLKGRR